ncbi:MAG: LysR family transcriptional regulator substrate-binding protein [Eubacterium sp.]|nr:LysR family transcriptional regulator substrate-binding protein [Eubacterium sp.]
MVNLRYHITSGDTEQIADKLDKGLLDFLVLAEDPDPRKYDYIEFPEADIWGLVVPKDHELAQKKDIHISDLIELPLFCSEQAWKDVIKKWAGSKFADLHLDGSFRLSYNGSVFTKEGLGSHQLHSAPDLHLIHTTLKSPSLPLKRKSRAETREIA